MTCHFGAHENLFIKFWFFVVAYVTSSFLQDERKRQIVRLDDVSIWNTPKLVHRILFGRYVHGIEPPTTWTKGTACSIRWCVGLERDTAKLAYQFLIFHRCVRGIELPIARAKEPAWSIRWRFDFEHNTTCLSFYDSSSLCSWHRATITWEKEAACSIRWRVALEHTRTYFINF